MKRINRLALASVMALVGMLANHNTLSAGFILPAPGPQTISVEGVSTLLGSFGTTDLPTNASTSYDELVIATDITGVTSVSGPTDLSGLSADLKLIAHTNSSGTAINDITPSKAPLTLSTGDYLFFGEAGRNELTGGPSGSGGYVLFSSGNGIPNNPSNWLIGSAGDPSTGLTLQASGSSFAVNNSGTITSGSVDNFTNSAGTAVNTSSGGILLAAKYLPLTDVTNIPTITFPTSFSLPTGAVFVEQVTAVTSSGITLKGGGILTVVGGSSAGVIGRNVTFTDGINEGSSSTEGTGDIAFAFASTIPLSNGAPSSANYSTWLAVGSDPLNYVGVPEPSSAILFSLGLCGMMAGWAITRRLRLAETA